MKRRLFITAIIAAIVFQVLLVWILVKKGENENSDLTATVVDFEKEYSRERLQKMAEAGGDWILRMQVGDGDDFGRFAYRIDAEDTEIPGQFDEDNFLRQAGTAYALLVLTDATGNDKYRIGAEKSIKYLLSRYRVDDRDSGRGYFEAEGQVKLGGTALPTLSLIRLAEGGSEPSYSRYYAPIGKFMLFMQKKNGRYRSVDMYRGSRTDKRTTWNSEIYPGEAMLALMRLYAVTNDTAYLQSVDRALAFYSAKPGRHDSAKFMPWTTSAMAEAYILTHETRYRDFAYTLADDLIKSEQNLDPEGPMFGGFHKSPSINTATYLDGLIDAYKIAKLEGDIERSARYRLSIFAGYRFVSSLQFDEMDRAGLRHGGFASSPDNADIRIDNTQHATCAFAKGLLTLF